jgi:hypothetical protein
MTQKVPFINGRGDWIRTSDHLTPSQVRYQTALRPGANSLMAPEITSSAFTSNLHLR